MITIFLATALIIICSLFLGRFLIKLSLFTVSISKKATKMVIIVALGLITITAYLIITLDKQLYYYGKNDWCIHDKLPFKIAPQYWGYDMGSLGFVLEKNNETLISKGKISKLPDAEINEIIKYGFNKEKLVALVNDSGGKKFYVVCIKNPNIYSKQDFTIDVVPQESFINNDPLKWIDIENVSTKQMELVRNYLEIFLLFLIFITTLVCFGGWSTAFFGASLPSKNVHR